MDTTDIDLLVSLTDCTPATAERVLTALVERGWSRRDPVDLGESSGPLLAGTEPLQAYTDGACSGNPGPGGWAVVFVRGGKALAEHSGAGGVSTTNNQMELVAAREAILRAPPEADLEIVTDSQNVIGWLSKGWKRNNPQVATLCAEFDDLARKRPGGWSFRYVKGHAGEVFNGRADALAVAAYKAVPRAAK